MTLNCIAVDDEPLALGLVCKFIEQTPFLNLVGRYSGAVDALKAIHSEKIDLIFLDIQMPDLNGIELARVLDKGADKPRIIFTTAYNQFALEGYKVDALDYLLKPFNYEEFLRAAQKAYNYAELINKPATVTTVVNEVESADDQYLFLKVEYQLVRIALDDILYIEGLKDYVKVHLKGRGKSRSFTYQPQSIGRKTALQTFFAGTPLIYRGSGQNYLHDQKLGPNRQNIHHCRRSVQRRFRAVLG